MKVLNTKMFLPDSFLQIVLMNGFLNTKTFLMHRRVVIMNVFGKVIRLLPTIAKEG